MIFSLPELNFSFLVFDIAEIKLFLQFCVRVIMTFKTTKQQNVITIITLLVVHVVHLVELKHVLHKEGKLIN